MSWNIEALITQGSSGIPVLLGLALILGALHAIEPGHAKTMTAAFLIAVRGTVRQAVLLGVSAALSHSIVVWILGIAAVVYGERYVRAGLEPIVMAASGVIILAIAGWTLFTIRRTLRQGHDNGHDHAHDHHHDHAHDHGHWHWHDHGHSHSHGPTHDHGHRHDHAHGHAAHHHGPVTAAAAVAVGTHAPIHAFAGAADHGVDGAAYSHGDDHAHEHLHRHDHHHDHGPHYRALDHRRPPQRAPNDALAAIEADAEDAHARAHASEIRRRFHQGSASDLQVVMFGLSGGLIPCTAALTIMILCLQLDRVWLGVGVVAAFSVGLAATLVAFGIAVALGSRRLMRRNSLFQKVSTAAPYVSAAVIALLGLLMLTSAAQAWRDGGESLTPAAADAAAARP